MNTTSNPEQFTFQAEIKQLLHLLSHSLYQNREIAIRELVSNASDALDKMRHIGLTDPQYADDAPLEIQLNPDKDNRVLEIADNGIGMTHDDLVQNLGTIAHSGSKEFINRLSEQQSQGDDLSLIGQFGVGFYSAFMLADEVEVITRSYQDEQAWKWSSDGTGSFEIEPTKEQSRGTRIRLKLKPDLEEFTEPARLQHILSKYSTFVPHPVLLDGERINDQRPIWVEPKSSLDEEQYHSFYQYLTHRASEKPLWYLHLTADSPFQFHSILYCPESNLELLGFGRSEHGLHLCAKRILVQNDCRDLLPEYLRFLYGLVDSADLPLNVSREALQDNTVFRKMRKVLVRKVLDHLAKLAKDDQDAYLKFYRQFGAVLREGIAMDFDHRDKIASLMRYHSSHDADPEVLLSLDDYIGRTPEDQKKIYYTTGPQIDQILRQPGLEIFRKKKIEVLYLLDPIDEIVLNQLGRYNDYELVSIDADDVELPASDEAEDESKEQTDDDSVGFPALLTFFREALGDRVEEVRRSDRLTDSPCCLVNPKGAMSTQLERVLQMQDKDFEISKRIFEVNPQAPLIQRLCALTANTQHIDFIKECARQLFSNAELQAGLITDPDGIVDRSQSFMQELAQQRSPIVT